MINNNNNKGFSLIEVMISIGIMMVGVLATFQMITTQQNETRALTEKLAALDLQKLALATINDAICTFVLTDASQSGVRSGNTINTTNPSTLSSSIIYLQNLPTSASSTAPKFVVKGSPASPLSSSVVVNNIQLRDFAGTGNRFTANFKITFNQDKVFRPLKDISVSTNIFTDPSSPSHAKKILACSSISFTPVKLIFPTTVDMPFHPNGPWPFSTYEPPRSGCSNATRLDFYFSASGGAPSAGLGNYVYSFTKLSAPNWYSATINATTGLFIVTGDKRCYTSTYRISVTDGETTDTKDINVGLWW